VKIDTHFHALRQVSHRSKKWGEAATVFMTTKPALPDLYGKKLDAAL